MLWGILHKHPIWLKPELIRFWWLKVKIGPCDKKMFWPLFNLIRQEKKPDWSMEANTLDRMWWWVSAVLIGRSYYLLSVSVKLAISQFSVPVLSYMQFQTIKQLSTIHVLQKVFQKREIWDKYIYKARVEVRERPCSWDYVLAQNILGGFWPREGPYWGKQFKL